MSALGVPGLGGCLLRGVPGGCLFRGGVPDLGGVPGPGGAWSGRVSALGDVWSGGAWSGGCLLWGVSGLGGVWSGGGGYPSMH